MVANPNNLRLAGKTENLDSAKFSDRLRKGEIAEIQAPNGVMKFRIDDITI